MQPPIGPRHDAPPPAPAPERKDAFSIAALVVGALVLVWLVFGPSDSQPAATGGTPALSVPEPSPTLPPAAPAPPPVEVPAQREPETVTVEAEGDGNSRPLELNGGDYLVTVTVRSPCCYAFDLEPIPDGRGIRITRMDEVGETTTYLYGLDAGRYFVSVSTGPVPSCPWRVTVESQ